jgi:hypothetical protein
LSPGLTDFLASTTVIRRLIPINVGFFQELGSSQRFDELGTNLNHTAIKVHALVSSKRRNVVTPIDASHRQNQQSVLAHPYPLTSTLLPAWCVATKSSSANQVHTVCVLRIGAGMRTNPNRVLSPPRVVTNPLNQ